MTVRRGEPAAILRYDSPAYRVHHEHIEAIEDSAERLGLLQGKFKSQILGPSGIVCDRPAGDDGESVARSYYGLAVRVANPREERGAQSHRNAQIRELLFRVLAVHLSVSERPQEEERDPAEELPVETYRDLIADAQAFAEERRVRSLLPNLFDAASLGKQIAANAYDWENPSVHEYFGHLAAIMSYHPRHLHAVTTALGRNGAREESVAFLEQAAQFRGEPVLALCADNPLQAETYVQALFESGDVKRALEFCREFGTDRAMQNGTLARFLLLALLRTEGQEEALALLTANAATLRAGDRHVRKTVGIACEEIGWYLYGLGRNEEGIALLQSLVPEEIGPHGRTNMQCLYSSLNGEDIAK